MGCRCTKYSEGNTRKSEPKGPGEDITYAEQKEFAKYFCYLDKFSVLHLYNTETEEYKTLTHTKISDGDFQQAFAKVANRIYLAGGMLDKKPHSQCLMFKLLPDMGVSERLNIADLDVPRMGNSLVPMGLRTLYCIGGFSDRRGLSSCEKYNIRTNTWEKAAPLNEGKGNVASCCFKDEILYVFGGRFDPGRPRFSTAIERLDTVANSNNWVVLDISGDAYKGNFLGCACAQFGEDILICEGPTGCCWKYSVATQQIVDAKQNLPQNAGFEVGATEYKNALYLVDREMTMLICNTDTGEWKAKTKAVWAKAGTKTDDVFRDTPLVTATVDNI